MWIYQRQNITKSTRDKARIRKITKFANIRLEPKTSYTHLEHLTTKVDTQLCHILTKIKNKNFGALQLYLISNYIFIYLLEFK